MELFVLVHAAPIIPEAVSDPVEKPFLVFDQVCGYGDGDQGRERGDGRDVVSEVPYRQSHGDDDQAELADLRDIQSGEKRDAFGKAQKAHDPEHDRRVSDQDEDAQQSGGHQRGRERLHAQPGSERYEKEYDEKVS